MISLAWAPYCKVPPYPNLVITVTFTADINIVIIATGGVKPVKPNPRKLLDKKTFPYYN